MLNYLLKL